MDFNNDGFKEITGKKKIRKKIVYKNKNIDIVENEEIDLDLFIRKFSKINLDMGSSPFFSENLALILNSHHYKQMKNIEKLICLGVGSFTRNLNCLHQLVFFLTLSKKLFIKDIEFYDPIFNETEKEFLKSQTINVTSCNMEGFYPVNANTLICLPHCPTELTNNVLWENWDSKKLNKLILLCSSIEDNLTKHLEKTIDKNYKQLKHISPYTKELRLKNNYQFEDIFNDMVFHFFDLSSTILDEKFWHKDEKPTNISTEMITNKIKMLKV